MKNIIATMYNKFNSFLSLIERDKFLHFVTGVFLFAIMNVVFGAVGFSESISALFTLGGVIGIGILKELILDAYIVSGNVDAWDAVATGLGGVIGFLCGFWFF